MCDKCRFCFSDTLDPKLEKGKIVLCEGRSRALGASIAEAIGALTQGQNFRDTALTFALPASYLDLQDATNIYSYLNSTRY